MPATLWPPNFYAVYSRGFPSLFSGFRCECLSGLCGFPVCEVGSTPRIVSRGDGTPGKCCDVFECVNGTWGFSCSHDPRALSFPSSFSKPQGFSLHVLSTEGLLPILIKNLRAEAGDLGDVDKRCGFDPWVRKIPWRRACKAETPVLWPPHAKS